MIKARLLKNSLAFIVINLNLHFMKKILFSTLFLMICIQVQAQLEERFWIFGRTSDSNPTNENLDFYPDAGPLYDTSLPPSISSPPSEITPENGFEGWAVATDPVSGELMFYTDGRSVFNSDHEDISPAGGLEASPSSAQPVALCVEPILPIKKYYVFCNPTGKEPVAGTTTGPGSYRIFDKTTESFSASNPLPGPYGTENIGEGMLIIPSKYDHNVFYLITRLLDPVGPIIASKSRYVVYKVDPLGVSFNGAYDLGPGIGTDVSGASPIMNMAYSEDRNPDPYIGEVAFTASKISPSDDNYIFVCEFNNNTGEFLTGDSEELIAHFSSDYIYDCEYSPDSKFLYYSTYYHSELFQYQFTTGNIYTVGYFGNARGGGLKIGPDDNIYHIFDAGTISNTGTLRIGRITAPNTAIASNYNDLDSPAPIYDFDNIISRDHTFAYNFPEFLITPYRGSGIDELTDLINSKFDIYPNPTENSVTFEYDFTDLNLKDPELQIKDLLGKNIELIALISSVGSKTISLSNLPSGVYTVSILSGSDIVGYSKIVKVE